MRFVDSAEIATLREVTISLYQNVNLLHFVVATDEDGNIASTQRFIPSDR